MTLKLYHNLRKKDKGALRRYRGGGSVKCPRCGNEEESEFFLLNGERICRKCLKFQGRSADIAPSIRPKDVAAKINYRLSEEQRALSDRLLRASGDVYVSAVCGAGKTEIVFASIEQALREGKRVGFIIPRREVCKEIAARLRRVYPRVAIIEVYGGHTSVLDGDIAVLTTHQAYRYRQKFGLIIVDEYDAFPFRGDDVLRRFVDESCYGRKIFLSATFNADDLRGREYVELNKRFHNRPLPVPIYRYCPRELTLAAVINEIRKLEKKKTTVFVYVPTIAVALSYYRALRRLFPPCTIYHSKIKSRKPFWEIKEGKYRVAVCTTIFERGITIKNLDVVVAYADDPVFTRETLIQIAGRVGRVSSRPSGAVIFLAPRESDAIREAIEHIESRNRKVSFMPPEGRLFAGRFADGKRTIVR